MIDYSNSSLEKDLTLKRKVYAEADISEYWVINLKTQELLVLREPMDGDYTVQQTLVGGNVSPLSFPEIAVTVSPLIR